ncbi:hypothetical protein [Neptunomonas phycophila]|uniref:hypothetical protein n=1 Tax=Neptunomonas phycophila TaxID=1572645 RepID=UPI0009490944|nr:hypothetical protein [Neptunomonas phycophila]
MSFKMRLLALIIMGTGLTACGGGGGSNDNLFNPAEDTTTDSTTEDSDPAVDDDTTDSTSEDSGLTTSDASDQYTISNEFIGFYIESPEYNPDDYSVGTIYLRTLRTPSDMEENYIFEGVTSFQFTDCQNDNLIAFWGDQDDDSSLDSYQATATIDGTTQSFTLDSVLFADDSYKGAYNFVGSDNITVSGCATYTLATRGKVELYPLNTTQFTDQLSDAVVSFDTSNPRRINFQYTGFSGAESDIEHISISVIDKTALDNLNQFENIYSAIYGTESSALRDFTDRVEEITNTLTQSQEAETTTQQTDLLLSAESQATELYNDWVSYTGENSSAVATDLNQAQTLIERMVNGDELTSSNNYDQAISYLDSSIDDYNDLVNDALVNYRPALTASNANTIFLHQNTIPGNSTYYDLPSDVTLATDDYYILNITAWSSDDESNFVYYHSSHVYRAD